jgi:hypothetical protein
MNLFTAILCFFVASTCTTTPPNNGNLFQTDSPSVVQSVVTTKHTKHYHKKKPSSVKLQQARRKALDELFPEVARRIQHANKINPRPTPPAVTGHCKMDKCKDCKYTEKSGIQRCKPTLCTHKDCPFNGQISPQSSIPKHVQDRLG